MIEPRFADFLASHRWALLTTLRASGLPANSMVAYASDGDTFVVSTPGGTLKARTLARDPRVVLTAISNAEPFNFVSVEGRAVVERQGEGEGIERATRLVFANIRDHYPEPPDLAGWMREQRRVILRVVPERVSGVIR
ncbi:MAG: TIGR03618 family F420-dependent PPOX class oxidoreductase [Pseudomonadota bacterium]